MRLTRRPWSAYLRQITERADPDSRHGWLGRLVDGDVLGAAGFVRLREIEL